MALYGLVRCKTSSINNMKGEWWMPYVTILVWLTLWLYTAFFLSRCPAEVHPMITQHFWSGASRDRKINFVPLVWLNDSLPPCESRWYTLIFHVAVGSKYNLNKLLIRRYIFNLTKLFRNNQICIIIPLKHIYGKVLLYSGLKYQHPTWTTLAGVHKIPNHQPNAPIKSN